MILLTAAKIPEDLDKDMLATAVSLMFPHPHNNRYIENIRGRQNDGSAIESLFALSLLYEQIRSLPCNPDTDSLILSRTETGKPYFQGSDVKFNLSHSKGYVACAAALDEELGVDVEASYLPPERALKMAERYFDTEEFQIVKKCPEAFARIWSEKESKSKFLGENLGKFLEKEKNGQNNRNEIAIRTHSFRIGEIPVILCTKRDFSTIIFTVQ